MVLMATPYFEIFISKSGDLTLRIRVPKRSRIQPLKEALIILD